MARKKNRIIKCFIGVICTLIICVVVFVSPIFNIKHINIIGNTCYDDERIIEIIGISVDDNWFKKVSSGSRLSIKNILMYRYFDGEDNLKRVCPYIKDVRVSLSGFNKYTVTIKEREPVAKVMYLAQYVIIDDCGVALDIVEDEAYKDIPEINGVTLNNVRLGEKIGMKEEKIEAFCKVYNIINESDCSSKERFYKNQAIIETYNDKEEEQLYKFIEYMDFSKLDDISFFLDGRILVYLGDINSINEHKINYLKEIFFNNIEDEEEGVLNFRAKKNPTYTKKIYALMNKEKLEEDICYW